MAQTAESQPQRNRAVLACCPGIWETQALFFPCCNFWCDLADSSGVSVYLSVLQSVARHSAARMWGSMILMTGCTVGQKWSTAFEQYSINNEREIKEI